MPIIRFVYKSVVKSNNISWIKNFNFVSICLFLSHINNFYKKKKKKINKYDFYRRNKTEQNFYKTYSSDIKIKTH